MDERQQLLKEWTYAKLINLKKVSSATYQWEIVSGDASFRRYFRLKQDLKSWIAVDAPPEYEKLEPFILVDTLLTQAQIRVPEVVAYDLSQGLMLLSDFGDLLFLSALKLNNGLKTSEFYDQNQAEMLYQQAIQTLVHIQAIPQYIYDVLPLYDEIRLKNEMLLLKEWHIEKFLGHFLLPHETAMINAFFDSLTHAILQQPQVFVHRDFHSRNLMVLPSNALGVIDFQDALKGAVTYDWVSIFKDCYVHWPRSQIEIWLKIGLEQLKEKKIIADDLSLETWLKWFDTMGLQRHIKIAGIFSRLYLRDGKAGYLNDIPLTYAYILDACKRIDEFSLFSDWLKSIILPKYFAKNPEAEVKITGFLAALSS